MTTDHDDAEPIHTASTTAHILDQLQLHGYQSRPGEPDMRPLPEDEAIDGAIADIFDALTGTDRRHRLPGLGHLRQSRRQGEDARHSGLASREMRRVSAAFFATTVRRDAGATNAPISIVYSACQANHIVV